MTSKSARARLASSTAAISAAGQPTIKAAPPPQGQLVFGPEVKPASQVSVGISSNEVGVTLGVSRVVLDAATGLPSGAQAVEWQVTYALSATTARSLSDALARALTVYEERFGKIPADPDAKMTEFLSG